VTISELIAAVSASLNGCRPAGERLTIEHRIVVPGLVRGLAVNPTGTRGYVSTGSALIELDLERFEPVRNLFLPGGNTQETLSTLDPTGTQALLYNFNGARVITLADGMLSPRVGGGSSGRSVFANGKIYTPSFNGRGVVVATDGGLDPRSILPFPPEVGVAGPGLTARTPDGSHVIFDDEFNDAIHVIDTASDRVIASIPVGFDPLDVVAVDNSEAIVFVHRGYAVMALDDPFAVPRLTLTDVLAGQPIIAPGPNPRVVVIASITASQVPEIRVAVLDTASGVVRATEALPIEIEGEGNFLSGLAVTPDGSRILLATGPSVYVIRPQPGLL
jgi:YVTN family beta-propeller protein